MKKIYVVTTYTGTVLSYIIRNFSGKQYSHVSLAISEDLNPMYSFGRLIPTNPIFAGFVEENIDEGLYAIKKGTVCRVYSLEVTDFQYEELGRNIKRIKKNRDKFDYDRRALLCIPLHVNRQRPFKYVCSNFVATMLDRSGINILDKPSYNVKPNDYYDLEGLNLEYEGLISHYNRRVKSTIPEMLNY
jgi:hypothetical protein